MGMLRRINPLWPLRIGLGLMYLYSGIGFLRNPLDWQGFLPTWFAAVVERVIPLSAYLAFQGIGELALAAVFLGWFLPLMAVRIAAVAAALEFAGILLFTGLDLITFRDIGLLGAAIALVLLAAPRRSGDNAT